MWKAVLYSLTTNSLNAEYLCYNYKCYGYTDSSVGLVTRYGQGGPGSCPWGRDFPGFGSTHPTAYRAPGLFNVANRPGAWCWPHTLSSTRVKGRVELYFYSPSQRSWPVTGRISALMNTIVFELRYRSLLLSQGPVSTTICSRWRQNSLATAAGHHLFFFRYFYHQLPGVSLCFLQAHWILRWLQCGLEES